MVLTILIMSFIVGILIMIIRKISILISIVGIRISIIIHGSAPLTKQEIRGMPNMYKKKHCS